MAAASQIPADRVAHILGKHAALEEKLRSDHPTSWDDLRDYRRLGRMIWHLRRVGHMSLQGNAP